jgi:predicted negative regulator of RcsB-dependent stress response
MAILQTDEANIIDAENFNWRLVVYPLLAILIIGVLGLSYYLYQQNAREEMEASARAALIEAKTPADLAKVADQFPGSDQATLALLSAATDSFSKHDYATAIQDYQRVLQSASTSPSLIDSAQLGLASAQDASGKPDDAITAYQVVAQRGDKSPFAPYAYNAIANIYEQRGDKDNERKTLTEIASLDPDSSFVKQAQYKLKQLAPPAPAPSATPAPAAAAPTPTAAPAAVTPPSAPTPAPK